MKLRVVIADDQASVCKRIRVHQNGICEVYTQSEFDGAPFTAPWIDYPKG